VIPTGSRWALWCLALLLSLTLLIKGRVLSPKGEDAAFPVAPPAASVLVRLAGNPPRPGIFRFPAATSVTTAIKMTLPDLPLMLLPAGVPDRPLLSGDILTLRCKNGKVSVLSLEPMSGKERMLLGIPLDPDRLEVQEWEALPGIGPVLAARIVADRQENGAFGGLEGVLRVPGIGAGTLERIKRYF
jgi:competence protein ComEA